MKDIVPHATAVFWRQLREHESIRPPLTPDDYLLIAVSGGADSLALLHLFIQQRLYYPERIIVAHLNHGWRETAAAEAEFVAQTAQAWGVPCVVGAVDAPAFAERHSLSLEEASRRLRYDFLRETAVNHKARIILTGHQANDQAETVLHNLLRGSGLTGLRGMLPLRRLSDDPPVWLARPLLQVTRQQIDAYCEWKGLTPIADPSNDDVRFLRNRLRAELLPLLRQYNPQVDQHLYQLADVAAAEVDFVEEAFQSFWREILYAEDKDFIWLNRRLWQEGHLALRRRALREAATRLAGDQMEIGLAPIELARLTAEKMEAGAVSLPGALSMRAESGLIEVRLNNRQYTVKRFDVPQLGLGEAAPLPVPGRLSLSDKWEITAETNIQADMAAVFANNDPWQAYLDQDKIGTLTVRGRIVGEKFDPLGMDGRRVKMKDFMNGRKIPPQYRDQWPIIADESGVVWVAGQRLAGRVKVTAVTRRMIRLTCRPVRQS
jgi:tRNA(Ile)-lysidine synthase